MNRKLLAFACLSWPLVMPVFIASGHGAHYPVLARIGTALVSILVMGILLDKVRDVNLIGKPLDEAFAFLAFVLGSLLTFGFVPIGENPITYVLLACTFYAGCRLLMVPPTPAQLAK